MRDVPAITWLDEQDYAHVTVTPVLTACGKETIPLRTWLTGTATVRCGPCREVAGDLTRDDGTWRLCTRDRIVHQVDLTARVQISLSGLGKRDLMLVAQGSPRCHVGPAPRDILSQDDGRVDCLACLEAS